jgi:hypothetical protein
MKSPHGQPSPELLRSIHRPYPRHNAAETGGDLITKRLETGSARVSPAQPRQKRLIADTGAPHHALLIRLLDLKHT